MKTYPYYALLIFAILLTNLSYSQTLFTANYGGADRDAGKYIIQSSDGDYVVAGYTRSFGGYDFYILKMDTQGTIVWSNAYPAGSSAEAFSIAETSDGGFIAAGSRLHSSQGWDGFLVKIDAEGKESWSKKINGNWGDNDYITDVVECSDGNIAITGYIGGGGAIEDDLFLMKLDNYGNEIWNHVYGEYSHHEKSRGLKQTADNGFIMAGTNSNDQALIIKSDSLGNREWYKVYEDTIFAGLDLHDIHVLEDNSGYICTGYAANSSDLSLLKVNASGTPVWCKFYDGGHDDYGRMVKVDPRGDYVIAGATRSNGNNAFNFDFFLMKTDKNGAVTWSRAYQPDTIYAVDKSNSMVIDSDNKYVMLGTAWGQTAGLHDVCLIKTNSNGDAACLQYDIPLTVTDVFISITDANDTSTMTIQFDSISVSETNVPSDTNMVCSVEDTSSIGIVEKTASEMLRIYPVPTTGVLQVEADEKLQSITVFDLSGRYLQTYSIGRNKAVIDMTAVVPGFYFIEVRTIAGTVIRKKILRAGD